MKKIITIAFIAFVSMFLYACESSELIIYLPNAYISEDVVIAFEKEYNVRVDIRTFDSNEIALTQARINRYDLIIPSDYAIEEFADEGLIKELDWSKIDLEKSELSVNLVTMINQLEEEGFDFLKYAMPYYWGSIGLLYDIEKAGLKDKIEAQGWGILADQSFTKMIYKSPRDAFMAALYAQDPVIELADATENDIKAAKDWLIAAKGNNTILESDEILDKAQGGNVPYDIAMVYSGDAVVILQETPRYEFFIPEWSNAWVDGFVIPKNSRNEEMAYNFINFISSYEQMYENTDYLGYSPVRQDVLEAFLEDEEFIYDERVAHAFDIDVTTFNFEFFRYNKELKGWIDNNYDLFILS